jgi:hypothetical protein
MKRTALLLLLTLLFLVPPLVVPPVLARTDAGTASLAARKSHRVAGFRGGKTISFPDGLAITLLSYGPVTGLTFTHFNIPLRPRSGYRFVTTTWLVRNTTDHTVGIKTGCRGTGSRSTSRTLGNGARRRTTPIQMRTWLSSGPGM